MAGKQKGSKKVGRSKRKPSSSLKSKRIYENKLRRVNRDRAKSGKPPIATLPIGTTASICYLGK